MSRLFWILLFSVLLAGRCDTVGDQDDALEDSLGEADLLLDDVPEVEVLQEDADPEPTPDGDGPEDLSEEAEVGDLTEEEEAALESVGAENDTTDMEQSEAEDTEEGEAPDVENKEPEVVEQVPLQDMIPPEVNVTEYLVTDEVWFEVKIKKRGGNEFVGRFVVALFGELLPLTTLNFVSLARGYRLREETLTYKKSVIHRVVQDFVIQMGDITESDGTGGRSIFGYQFQDEHFGLRHRSPGWVAMANRGRNSNQSQFYIMLTKARWLDGKNVVFGKVVRGFDVLDEIAAVPTDRDSGKPKDLILINDCGVLSKSPRYKLPDTMLSSTKDYHPEGL